MIDLALLFKQKIKSPMKEMHMLHEINTLAPDINQDSRGLLTWTIFFFWVLNPQILSPIQLTRTASV